MPRFLFPLLLALLASVGCGSGEPAEVGPSPAEPRAASGDTVDVQGVAAARARLEGDVSGTVSLRQFDGGVRVQADVSGLGDDELYGLQVLSARSCDGADPSAHLGDGRTRHGAYDAPTRQRHAGDLGNVRSDDRGSARYDRFDAVLTLSGFLSPVGRAVVIRQRQDDGWSQPDGGAGEILACGVLDPTR